MTAFFSLQVILGHNQQLTEKREQSVYTYLKSHGIDASRLFSKGYGQTKPKATNDTEEGRQMNRRIEFVQKVIR